ncbi:MAG: hypothetical protein ABEJ30_05620 [Halorientalis sp.]
MPASNASYGERILALQWQYRADREAFEPPADPPAPDRATALCREGLGPTVMVYVDARTSGSGVTFTDAEFDALHEALNGYLELYAACYGVDFDADVAVREAAELLLDTHNARDVAAMLTHLPE